MEATSNKVICPQCGKVRLETPPGTKILPTLGMARKAAGVAGTCPDCGRTPPAGPALEAVEEQHAPHGEG